MSAELAPERAVIAPPRRTLLLSNLLARSAAGDREAFMEFYDLTSGTAYCAARLRHGHERAEEAVLCRYSEAWDRAAQHASSGLSPLAWLLSLTHD